MIMMGNNNNLAAGSAEPDQVEASHSLDDSENSQALHNNDMFFDADLDRLFDDDEVAGGADGSSGVEYDSGILVVEEHQQEETQSEIRQQKEQSQPDQPISNAEGIPSTITTQSSTTNVLVKPKLKRRNSNLEGENRGLPPPGWHSEAADRHHRQEMILEIARLLQARKKVVPSDAWLRELPHKARKLEGRLYKTAPSLEAYLDRRTLKVRLKRLARALVRHFGDSKRSSFRSTRSSISTTQTIPTRDSIHSTDSSRSPQPAMPSRSLISSSRKSQSWSEGRKSRTEIPTESVTEAPTAEIPEPAASGAVPDQAREPAPGPSSRRSSSVGTKSGTGRAGAPSPSVSQEQLQQFMFEQQQQLLLKSELSRQSLEQNNLMSSSALQASSDSGMTVQPTMSSSLPNRSMEMGNPNITMTDLERQKAVTERLQQQIAENIRRQEELVRRLQGPGSSQDASTLSRNSGAIGDMAGNTFGTSMPGPMEPNAVQFNNHPSNSLNMMGMPTAVQSNPGMAPQTLNFLMNQQHRQQQPRNIANPSQMQEQQQQQQHLFNFQQATNLNLMMGFRNNANMMPQSFGSQPQAAQNTLMQQSHMMQGLFGQSLPGGTTTSSNLNAQQQMMISGNSSGLACQQPIPPGSSMPFQQQQQQQQQEQHISSADSRRTSYSSAGTGQGSNRDSTRNSSSHNNSNVQPQSIMELSQQPGSTGNNTSTSGQVVDEGSANLDASNNDGDNDSPLSPNSFRW